jgi:hypothetical protein
MTRAGDLAQAMLTDPPPPAPTPTVATVDLSAALAGIVDAAENGRPIVEVLPCGLPLIDTTAGGFVRGEFAGLVAAPGLGKSMLVDRLALNALRATPGTRVLIAALETAIPVRAARLLCGDAVRIGNAGEIIAGLRLGQLLHGTLAPDALATLRDVADRLRDEVGARLSFVDSEHDARRLADLIRERKPDLFVLDHCGLLVAPWAGTAAVEAFDAALHEITGALREANTAGILIAELSKAALAGGATDVGAVRGSARFASLAGQLLTIRRVVPSIEQAAPTPNGPQHLRVELHKSRHGRAMVAQNCQLWGGLGHLLFDPRVAHLDVAAPKQGRNRGK